MALTVEEWRKLHVAREASLFLHDACMLCCESELTVACKCMQVYTLVLLHEPHCVNKLIASAEAATML